MNKKPELLVPAGSLDKLKTAIQQCLTYDLVLNAHGGIGKKPLINSNGKDVKYYADFYKFSREAIKKDASVVIKKYGKMIKGGYMNISAEELADDIAHAIKDGKATYTVMNIKDKSPNANIWSAISFDTKSINITLNMSYDLAFKEMVVYNLLHCRPKSIDDDVNINDFSAITEKIYRIFIKYLKLKSQADDGTFDYHYSNIDGDVIGGGDEWQFNIKYLDGKTYTSIKDVLKMAKSKGFDKILLSSCNVGYFEKSGLGGPEGFDLPKDLTRNVTFAKNPIWKETFIDDNHIDYYNESTAEDDIYGFLNDFENDYRAIAESYNIDYDNDQVLNEMYNYVISGQYLAKTATIHEGKLADIWHKIVEFIKKAIGFIIKLVKMFISWIKGIIDKIKERFSKKKKVKINKSQVKASFITVEGDNASITSDKEVSSYDELKELINKVMEAITKVFRKNSDEQVRLQNSLKNECERAANKQSSIGESYLGLYESTRVKSLINKNSNTMQQITSIIIPISNKVVNKRFNSVGNASVSNTMKKYSKSTNGMLNSNFSDINTIKAEYNLPKDKEVFSKMGKEYQWNEDFSNELDELTEFIKRMPRIKEICSNVTWETHSNKFCICFHIKKQLLDYSSND